MKRFYLLFVLFALAFGSMVAANTPLSSAANAPEKKSVIIRLKKQFDAPAYAQKSLNAYTGTVKRKMMIRSMKEFTGKSQGNFLATLDQKGIKLDNVEKLWLVNIITAQATDSDIEKLKNLAEVESVTIDRVQKLVEEEQPVNMTAAGEQSSQVAYNVEIARAIEANSYGYTGEGVIVGVVDTGINTDHKDLEGSFWENPDAPGQNGWNCLENNSNTKDETSEGHGTHCSGTVAGKGVSGTRTGIAPGVKLMALRVMDRNGAGTQTGVMKAVEWGAEHGANILSMSLGFSGPTAAEKKNWRELMTNLLEMNVLAVVAAGNEGENTSAYLIPDNVRTPGTCPAAWLHPEQPQKGGTSSVVTIGALKTNGTEKLGMSSIGPAAWGNIEGYGDYPYKPGDGLIKPDLAFCGQDVVSLSNASNTGYRTYSGTSMATPAVAGMVALMLSKNPNLTPAEIVRILSESSVKISPAFNNYTGAGRADALNATFYTPNVDMNCTSITVKETKGLVNGYLNAGDEANLDFVFKNESGEDISDYTLEVTCPTEHATMTVNKVTLPVLKAGESITIENLASVKIAATAQTGYPTDFMIVVRKGDKVWTNLLRLPVSQAKVKAEPLKIEETANGNGNGLADNGETLKLTFPLIKAGTEPCRKVTIKLESNTPSYITLTGENKDKYVEEMPDEYDCIYDCTVNADAPRWHAETFKLSVKGENIDTTFVYQMPIGKKAALVIDRSKNHSSANAFSQYLTEQKGLSCETTASMENMDIDFLKQYHSIWLFAGVYPKANALTQEETGLLKEYLDNGGYLYLEGGDLWYKDKATMNDYCKVGNTFHNGGKLTKIVGCSKNGYDNTAYQYDYSYASSSVDTLEAVSPAFALYRNAESAYTTTVAYIDYSEKEYRTIASSFEIGGVLTEGDNAIADSYLEFFLIQDGYFTEGIQTTTGEENSLRVNCFKAGTDCLVNIVVPVPTVATISVYGADGQLVGQTKENVDGQSTVRIPTYRKGIHFITVQAGGESVAKKMLF